MFLPTSRAQDDIELVAGWDMALAAAGQFADAAQAQQHAGWKPAGHLAPAEAIFRRGGFALPAAAKNLHDCDVWYRLRLDQRGDFILAFEGLATITDVWLDDRLVLQSNSMFARHHVRVTLHGGETLVLAFRSLGKRLAEVTGKRARWRVPMIVEQTLRFLRTTLLGHMPGWCPDVAIVGPWRPIRLIAASRPELRDLRIEARLDGGTGNLSAGFTAGANIMRGQPIRLRCGGQAVTGEWRDDQWSAQIAIADVEPWWPHSHGEPHLYAVDVELDGAWYSLGKTGFRSLVIERGKDGADFAFVVNGERVFARGVCWSPPDIVAFPSSRDVYERELRLARDAGINLIRVCGTTVYEPQVFHDLADELGIMIWQDLMLANFDYPVGDPIFRQTLLNETKEFLAQRQGSPSLVVLCGGSEISQQAAMMGLPSSLWSNSFLDEDVPALLHALRPDVAYVVNSPCDGDLPFVADYGVGHYYGVGAYRRPLEDARRADVAFAAECLAFSNMPSRQALAAMQLDEATPLDIWKTYVPRDRGASWDFEDIRHHYMHELYGVDPEALKRQDFSRYVGFAQAATAEVMEAVFAEWRRPRGRTAGGVVLMWKDLAPSLGWGVVDHAGEPKAAYYALKRAFRPVQLLASDEGVNGLQAHVLNERARTLRAILSLECLRDGHVRVAQGAQEIEVSGRSTLAVSATALLGGFFDTTYAYRFGPPAHDANVLRLTDRDSGDLLVEAVHFPSGRGQERHDAGLEAAAERQGDQFWLVVSCKRLAQAVTIEDRAFQPGDNYFHLAPGAPRRILLSRMPGYTGDPGGIVSALNASGRVKY
ncbi:glycoside hydrolase family 2 protein [Roseiarcaceae bacterium H3SJ34-1]|uniref:glycosyl hydrolase 2 galactose-binding domain-containing protein n=1 Tax=Terripilifer ovatus TaxID=3032367 RepID=UPI003AB98B4D|nr:glycoside hydrolase family 2 protein [Roseiarcaceae bacterium H3SJ34-1]